MDSARLIETSPTQLHYHVALRTRPNDDFPAEKLETLITLNRASETLETVELRLRESFRKAGVVKLKQFEMTVHFQPDISK